MDLIDRYVDLVGPGLLFFSASSSGGGGGDCGGGDFAKKKLDQVQLLFTKNSTRRRYTSLREEIE